MSQYSVIHAVDETLRSLIVNNLDTTSRQILESDPTGRISFKPPHRLLVDNTPTRNTLSLFLYRVVENGELRNRLLEAKNGRRSDPPLALNLFYLVTPLIVDKEGDEESAKNTHKLLGKVMRIFYDHGTLKGADLKEEVLQNTAEEFRIILNPISIEDMTKLWSSFMRPYYLSVSYEVKVVYIDSERETGAEQVRRKQLQFTQKAGV